MSAAPFDWCWDLVAASQRSGGWDPPTLFTLAEVADRFGHRPPLDASRLSPGELEAWVCTLVRFGVPLAWRCRDLGPPDVTQFDRVRLVRRVLVADALFPGRVVQHRWWLTAELSGSAPPEVWVTGRARRCVWPLSSAVAVQRWRSPGPNLSASEPVSVFGVCTAIVFGGDGVACFTGERAAAHISDLVDVPVLSRFMPAHLDRER